MSINIQPSDAERVRALAATHAYMTPRDIANLSGISLRTVKSALKAKARLRIKSVAK